MQLYLTISQIPELRALTRRQRKLVFQCGLEALFAEQPETVWMGGPWIVGGLIGGVGVGLAIMATGLPEAIGFKHQLLVLSIFGVVGVLLASFVAGQRLHARLRPYLRRVLEERKDEIAQIV